MSPADPQTAPDYGCQAFLGEDIAVTAGANLGDSLADTRGEIAETCAGDVYQLAPGARPVALSLRRDAAPGESARSQTLAAGSQVGRPGDRLILCGRLTLMAPDSDIVEMLLLRLEEGGRVLALPLSPMAPRTDYSLIEVNDDPGEGRLADIACLAFARGTRITLSDGRQMPIEALEPGMRVLTRDHGPQPLRWVGKAALRAIGSFAPVVISAGAMGNAGDLIVSQHHRMFLYRRDREPLLPTSELLVQARHLVDDEGAIFIREGGVVDYYSLVFDRHEIIYAEGIPAESLRVAEATVERLPRGLSRAVRDAFPELSQSQHFGTEADPQMLDKLRRDRLTGKHRDS